MQPCDTQKTQFLLRAIGGLSLALLVVCGMSCSSLSKREAAATSQPSTAEQASTSHRRVLRVCADPNNLPFSNQRLEGFENRLAELIAGEMDADLEYVWRAQRRGFFRHAFKDDGADVVMGVPAGFERALTTKPYYRSTYVFVTRKANGPAVSSFDDPSLHTIKVGIQIVGEDGQNPPPAYALARRGIVDNVVGYTVYGDYTEENPPARIVDAVAAGEVDVAVVWGPLAGYFAKRQPVALQVTPVQPQPDPAGLQFAFSIAVGVRKDGNELRDEIDRILSQRRSDVEEILNTYGLPRVPTSESTEVRDAG